VKPNAIDMDSGENNIYLGVGFGSSSTNNAGAVVILDPVTGNVLKTLSYLNFTMNTVALSLDEMYLYVGG